MDTIHLRKSRSTGLETGVKWVRQSEDCHQRGSCHVRFIRQLGNWPYFAFGGLETCHERGSTGLETGVKWMRQSGDCHQRVM